MSLGCSDMGNLFSTDKREVKKTVDCMFSLVRLGQISLNQRKKQSEMVSTKKIMRNSCKNIRMS